MVHITDAQADDIEVAALLGREEYCDGWRAKHRAQTAPTLPPIPATGDGVRDEWAGWIDFAGALSRGNEPPLPEGSALPHGRVVSRTQEPDR